MATMSIEKVSIPRDEAPETDTPEFTGDYDPEFPGSTPDAPYGYKEDGTPYKRRPKGSTKKTGVTTGSRRMPASESSARSAAGVLATVNRLVAVALHTGNMPETAQAISTANDSFEQMAYEALLADPILCKKILGAGATGGKTGLIMAYAMLGLSIVPAVRGELSDKRELREAQEFENAS